MLKELEALEKLKQNNKDGTHLFDDELLDKIATALAAQQKRIQELEETKCLMFIREIKIQKKLKVLEIIKKKRVDLEFLFDEWEEKNWEFALENYNMNHEIELTQEEYDLLKEVLYGK